MPNKIIGFVVGVGKRLIYGIDDMIGVNYFLKNGIRFL